MLLSEEQTKLRALVTEAIAVLCRNGLSYQHEVCVEGLLGITTDNQDVFLISLNEIIKHEEQLDQLEEYGVISTAQHISTPHRPGPLSSRLKKTARKRSHPLSTVSNAVRTETDAPSFHISSVTSINTDEPPSKRLSMSASSSPDGGDSERTVNSANGQSESEQRADTKDNETDSKNKDDRNVKKEPGASEDAPNQGNEDSTGDSVQMGQWQRSMNKKRKSGKPFRVESGIHGMEDNVMGSCYYRNKKDSSLFDIFKINFGQNKPVDERLGAIQPRNLLGIRSSSGSCSWNLEDAEDNPTTSSQWDSNPPRGSTHTPSIGTLLPGQKDHFKTPAKSSPTFAGSSKEPIDLSTDHTKTESSDFRPSHGNSFRRPRIDISKESSLSSETQTLALGLCIPLSRDSLIRTRGDSRFTSRDNLPPSSTPAHSATSGSGNSSKPEVAARKCKSFVCELCGKVYGTWAGRYYHNQMKHGAEKKFNCQFCDKGFSKGSDLNRHMQSRHKDVYICKIVK